jgi:hypothetical protein
MNPDCCILQQILFDVVAFCKHLDDSEQRPGGKGEMTSDKTHAATWRSFAQLGLIHSSMDPSDYGDIDVYGGIDETGIAESDELERPARQTHRRG